MQDHYILIYVNLVGSMVVQWGSLPPHSPSNLSYSLNGDLLFPCLCGFHPESPVSSDLQKHLDWLVEIAPRCE